MPLNEQEIRTSVYRGPFCDLLAELEHDPIWRKVKGSPEPEPRFREREMILRLFAFAHRVDQYRGDLRPFLNEYMARHAPREPSDVQRLGEHFRQTMRNVRIVFGEHAGHLYGVDESVVPPIGKWDTIFSIAALEIQAAALMGHAPAHVQAAAEQIREAYILYLLTNPQVRYAITRRPTAPHPSKARWIEFKAQVLRILDATDVEPRFFSYELRRQLFETSPVCGICSNQIHSFDDATVDHIYPWSKGGKTSPENAQLAHRLCNARKSAQLSFGQAMSIPRL
jgi:5-methylcytosine-specific restriction endonuclease McrA